LISENFNLDNWLSLYISVSIWDELLS
jgi:hypothetical protein